MTDCRPLTDRRLFYCPFTVRRPSAVRPSVRPSFRHPFVIGPSVRRPVVGGGASPVGGLRVPLAVEAVFLAGQSRSRGGRRRRSAAAAAVEEQYPVVARRVSSRDPRQPAPSPH